jgi:membrane fusion protein, multidrug efflux system
MAKTARSVLIRKLAIVPPVLLGVAVVVFLVLHHEGPRRKPPQEASRVLSVLPVPRVDVVPRVLGYGTAEPGEEWRAVAEVKGHLVWVNPELNAGAILEKGEQILRIDPREYELSIARLQADIEQVKAQIEELATREANYRSSLQIEEDSLSYAEKQLERTRTAAQSNAVSTSQVEQEERTVLSQRGQVQMIRNSLAIVPATGRSLEATLAVKNAGLAQARLDLDKTVFKAPFTCRIGEVHLEEAQYVGARELLFEAHGIDVSEVHAQVPLDQARPLLEREDRGKLATMNVTAMEAMRRVFDLDITVRYSFGEFRAEWPARFDRIREQLHPETRTIGIVVLVDKPYENVIPGVRPPLLKGMFCEVELRGKPRHDLLVVPRSALEDGHVYVVDDQGRLRRREVEVLFKQSSFASLAGGVVEGEMVVTTVPVPAIEGMLVTPDPNDALLARLIAEARAEVPLR